MGNTHDYEVFQVMAKDARTPSLTETIVLQAAARLCPTHTTAHTEGN